MKTDHKEHETIKNELKEGRGTLLSMLFSLFLVGLSVLFVVGFHFFLTEQEYDGKVSLFGGKKDSNEILNLDQSFQPTYIIIKNTSKKDIYATDFPGKVEDGSEKLEDGAFLSVVKKGTFEEKTYFQLSDSGYVEYRFSQVQEVTEYIPLEGYIAITYISSAGVHLRKWADFDADNIASTVYVADRVDIKAMVATADGAKAFQTAEGYYITTDSSYFTDYTDLKEKTKAPEEMTTEDIPSVEMSTEMPK
ncbi:MAG: hypothetical protein Q4E53_01805 [Eubacteriales bacterium]|nr:hypothetical protein [Eubacteriales bacterium]